MNDYRRKKLGISQEKLAEMADLSVQMVNSIEGHRAWVSDKTLVALSKALGIEVFQLYSGYSIKEERTRSITVSLAYENVAGYKS
jgi:transcriptional regulator with XRE-family HTH domain